MVYARLTYFESRDEMVELSRLQNAEMLYDKNLLFDCTVFEIGPEVRVKSLK